MTKTTTEDRDGYRITTVDHTVPDDTFEAAVKELWRMRLEDDTRGDVYFINDGELHQWNDDGSGFKKLSQLSN